MTIHYGNFIVDGVKDPNTCYFSLNTNKVEFKAEHSSWWTF
jgi:hypothetical protein